MAAFLKLIRFPNLIIVGLTQSLIYFLPFQSSAIFSGFTPILTTPLFFLLSFATIIIAASGYVINDIVDYEMDLVNKPQKVIVGKFITPISAYQIYYILIIIGFFISAYIAFQINNFYLLSVYPTAVGLLYFYSTSFKKKPFLGNLVVATFCAFVPGIILIADWQIFYNPKDEVLFLRLILFYMFFAFITTMIREAVKDIEDIEGDRLYNCQTIPIRYGQKAAVQWAIFLTIVMIFGLLFFQYVLSVAFLSIFYNVFIVLSLFFLSPCIYILLNLFKANEKVAFTALSKDIKYLMIGGLCYLVITSRLMFSTLLF